MDSTIGYNTQSVQIDSIYVEDIGNCALEAIDEDGGFYYIAIKTVEGGTDVIQFGPVIPDMELLPKAYKASFDRMSYSDTKLKNIIQKWALGGKGINFIEINQVSLEDVIAQDRKITDQFQFMLDL